LQNKILNNIILFGIIFSFILSSITPISHGYNIKTTKNETEYWALLIAVGVYAGHPEEDRPLMLTVVDDLHDMLLVSEHWKEDHIKKIKGEDATLWNIIKGLLWLNKMDDRDDFSLVYIATHGGRISTDKWPFDEGDGRDEVLATHRGFQYQWTNIRDDLLNLFLSLLSARGVCVIVDSCHSGGFNDDPYFNSFIRSKRSISIKDNQVSGYEWMQEIGEELRGKGRVVLMSCREDELSYGAIFTDLLIEGLRGYADTNDDDVVTAEEAFVYIEEKFPEWMDEMHPTIFDGYPGELVLTEVELPPSNPDAPSGQIIGDTNISYNYSTVSIDPEGDKISYGWDWDGDFILDEWTDFVDCNSTVNFSHSWAIEDTYNIRVKAKDERGVLSGWSNHTVVIMCDDNIPDQQQTNIGGSTNLCNQWVAQSFVPSFNTLAKFDLVLESWKKSGEPPPLHFYIRDNLSGDNLAESSRVIPIMDYDTYAWFTFEFEDLDVVPEVTYYIVCEPVDWPYWWYWYSDCYPSGEVFMSEDGIHWRPFHHGGFDCCFVTWGKF
jgi:hypothetical protein